MARPLAKSPLVLFALCLWILACSASLAEDDEIQKGKYQKEISFAEKAVETAKRIWGPEEPATADALDDLGLLLKKAGNYAKAEPLFQEALRIRQKVFGSENPSTANSLNNLAVLYQAMHEYAKAEPLYQEALRICRKVLGSENPSTALSLSNLAFLYKAMGEYAKAEPLYQEALRIRQKVLGFEHPNTAKSLNNLALLYVDMSEYTRAEPLYQEALRIRQKVLGSEHPDTATSLNNLAGLYMDTGEYTKAEPLYQEALRIRQKVLGAENPETATSLNELGTLYHHMGQYTKAESLYQETLRIRQKVLGSENPETLASLNNLASLYHATGEYAKAEPLLQEALRICQKVLGPEHPSTARSLSNLGVLYKDMGEYAKAEPLLQEALRINQEALGPQDRISAISLNNLASLYQAMGEYAKAEPLAQEALRIRQKVLGSENPETATSLGNLASLYKDMGEYAKAEPLAQEVLRIQQKVLGSEHRDTATSLGNLAELYKDMGECAKAEPLLQEALRIDQKVLGSENPDTVTSLNNLAGLYEDVGEYAKAEPLYQEALRIKQKLFGAENPSTARSINNLAYLYQDMGEYAKAEPLYQEALRIKQKLFGAEHPDTATSLNNLALLYDDMGEYAKAEPLYLEALRIDQKVLGAEDRQTAVSLNNLASLYKRMGQYAKAEPLYQKALRIWQEVLGPEHPDTATGFENLAYLEFDLGRIGEATALARQASAAQLTILSKIFSFTSEQQRLAYLDIFSPYSLFPILKGTETDLATAVLRYKGVVLDSIVEDRLLAEASQKSEDQKLVEQLNLDKGQLGQLLLQPAQRLTAETNQRIEALEGDVEKIESELAQHVAGLGKARHALGVRVEQVQATIPNDGALIEYLRYPRYLGKGKWERGYGAIVLFSKGAPLWIPLSKANEIEHLVRRYSNLVRGSPEEEELSANLQALYEALWAPIDQALPSQTKRIIISPDGQLNFISFATLLAKDKQFLAEKYSVEYVASGRDLLRELKPSTVKEVVLFANPDFGLASKPMLAVADNGSSEPGVMPAGKKKRDLADEIENWRFGSLNGTQKENDELIKKFVGWGWTPSDFTAKEATKEAVRKIHSPYILHLATHGFFAKEDPTATQSEPESPSINDRQSVTKSKFFKNPMHRSGLALAGAQTTIETWKRDEVPPVENDGILTAEDVSTLDLKGTWLVTLSACDTGSGEARAGEGVMGLRRGFIQAGAQNLLMTLWPISDEVTVQIMSDFYEAAHNTGNASEALAEVQRNWLLKLRTEKGLAQAVNLAGPFIMSSQGVLKVNREGPRSNSQSLWFPARFPLCSPFMFSGRYKGFGITVLECVSHRNLGPGRTSIFGQRWPWAKTHLKITESSPRKRSTIIVQPSDLVRPDYSTIACRSIWPTGRIRHFAYRAGSSAQYNSFSCSSRSVNRGSKRSPNQCRTAKLALLTLCMSPVSAVRTMSDVLRYQISNT
jgi:tetratricopeptide (TPR) repeat protein